MPERLVREYGRWTAACVLALVSGWCVSWLFYAATLDRRLALETTSLQREIAAADRENKRRHDASASDRAAIKARDADELAAIAVNNRRLADHESRLARLEALLDAIGLADGPGIGENRGPDGGTQPRER